MATARKTWTQADSDRMLGRVTALLSRHSVTFTASSTLYGMRWTVLVHGVDNAPWLIQSNADYRDLAEYLQSLQTATLSDRERAGLRSITTLSSADYARLHFARYLYQTGRIGG